jgi:hypothetical protein
MIRKLFSLVVLFVLFYAVFVPSVGAQANEGDYTIFIDDSDFRDNAVEVSEEVREYHWTLDHTVFAGMSFLGFGDECDADIALYDDGVEVYSNTRIVGGFDTAGSWVHFDPEVAFNEIVLSNVYNSGCMRMVAHQSWYAELVPVGNIRIGEENCWRDDDWRWHCDPVYVGDPGRIYVKADMPTTMTEDEAKVQIYDQPFHRISTQDIEIRNGYTDLGEATDFIETGYISIEGNFDSIAFGGDVLDEVDTPNRTGETELSIGGYEPQEVYGQFSLWIYLDQDALVNFIIFGQDEEYDYAMHAGWNEFELETRVHQVYIESQEPGVDPILYAMLVLGHDYEPDFTPSGVYATPKPESMRTQPPTNELPRLLSGGLGTLTVDNGNEIVRVIGDN